MSQLILHPHSIALRERVRALRAELASLLEERMRITFEELPAIRYRYTELFGELERDIERATLEMSERKRLVELFALKLDRGQKLDAKMIELTMKAVYKEFERIRNRVVREAGKERRKAEGSGWWINDTINAVENRTEARGAKVDLRKLYRQLAKQLHPDTRRSDDPVTQMWWDLVQRSYQREDLHALHTLINIVGTTGGAKANGSAESSTAVLEDEEKRLTEVVAFERERLSVLRTDEPFSLNEALEHEEWIDEKRATLEDELQSIMEETAKCDAFLAPILAGQGEDVRPETIGTMWSNFVEDVYLSGRY